MKHVRIFALVLLSLFLALTSNAQVKKTAIAKKSVTTRKKTAVKKAVKPVPVVKAVPVVKVVPVVKPTLVLSARTRIKIATDSGIIIVKLYDTTPLHRDNFVKLVASGFYDSLMFHRVIPEFMIQGGDPLSKNAAAGIMLGNGGGEMSRIPAEFRQTLRHKRGVLAAARDGNPEKASSAAQFYIVQGKKLTDEELNMIESNKGIKYTPEERAIYKTAGGTPFLDMEYTVFGEIESGIEVVNKIAAVQRDANNRPLGDVRMRMEIIK
ncbi:MAG: peptidylprolyl isomerase [Ferruginibacter sp.]